jgi:photosystem II stability/assembly factor-like uncharacterized protein
MSVVTPVRRLVSLLSVLLASPILFGGENVWTTNGPPGNVLSLAIDPQRLTLYAGTRLGPDQTAAFRSPDRGASWTLSGEAPPSTYLGALTVAPTTGTVFATTTDYFPLYGHLFQSTDEGQSWRFVSSIPTFSARSLQVSAAGVIYAAGSEWYCVRIPCLSGMASRSGVVESRDSGVTWSSLGSGLSGFEMTALGLDPSDPQRLYAGGTSGIFVSMDGGQHWFASNAGLGDCLSITSVAVDPRDSSVVFAGTTWATGVFECGGVFRSRDGGRTWAPTSFRNRDVASLAIDLQTPGTIYAGTRTSNPLLSDVGVFRSVDQGKTWTRLGSELPSGVAAVVIEASGRAIHAGTPNGVFDYEIVPGARPPVVLPRSRSTRTLPPRP